MTVSVVEVVTGTAAGNVATNYSITTSLVPSDLIVLINGRRRSTDVITLSGLGGATWITDANNTNGSARGLQVSHTSGVTGSGTVTFTNNASFSSFRVTILVIRGLNSVTLEGIQQTAFDSAGSTSVVTASQSFGIDQIAILAAMTSNTATMTIPTGSTPSSGWTVADNAASGDPRTATAYIVGTSEGTVVGGMTANQNTSSNDCYCLVFGTASEPAPVTFKGWGLPIF